ENNYTKYSNASFPEQDYAGPVYVVNQFTASDGTGSTYQDQFWYYGARVHAQGRGFEGFSSRRTYDTRNSLYTYDYYAQTFPLTGILDQTTITNGTHNLVSWRGNPTNTVSGGSGFEQRYFAFMTSTTEDDYELGGALDGQLITTV